MGMLNRIRWLCWHRYQLSLTIPGFRASPFSTVDKNSRFEGYNRIHGRSRLIDSSLGLFTYINNAVVVNSRLGRFCSIGPEARIGGLGRHPTRWLSTHPAFYSSARQAGATFVERNHFEERALVTIGHDVWVGARAMILDGIRVGDGAVIAAGAMVTRDVEPYAVVGGVPARTIRKRFGDQDIRRLQALQWWTWPVATLRQAAAEFRAEGGAGIDRLEKIMRDPHAS